MTISITKLFNNLSRETGNEAHFSMPKFKGYVSQPRTVTLPPPNLILQGEPGARHRISIHNQDTQHSRGNT